MKTENTVVDLNTTIASDLKQVELNLGDKTQEGKNGLITHACTKCNKQKPPNNFHKNKAKPNGLQAHCKTCTSKQKKAGYKKKSHKKQIENGFQVSVCGKPSNLKLSDFSMTLAEAVRELVDHEKL